MHEINNKIAYLVEFCTGSVDEKSLCKCPFHLCVFWICVLSHRICMVPNTSHCLVVRNMFMMFF